jgi:hypothetical protein
VTTVVVDAENVRRSIWPNLSPEQLVERVGAWAREHGHRAIVVFDGRTPAVDPEEHVELLGTGTESADDRIAELAAELDQPFWLVTSDRELRRRAGDRAEKVLGGGSFVREI